MGAGARRLRPIGIRRSRDGIEVAVEGGVREEWLGRAIVVTGCFANFSQDHLKISHTFTDSQMLSRHCD